MADIFVSYRKSDLDKVAGIVDLLEAQGWSVWIDTRLGIGETWDEVIERELGQAKCVVVVWTPASIQSQWVRNEAREGKRRGVLAPVLLGLEQPPVEFNHVQSADFRRWTGDASDGQAQKLIAAITKLAGKSTPVVPEPPPKPAVTPEEVETERQRLVLNVEREHWFAIRKSRNAAEIEAFLAEHPSGVHAGLARLRLSQLAGKGGGGSSGGGVGRGALVAGLIGVLAIGGGGWFWATQRDKEVPVVTAVPVAKATPPAAMPPKVVTLLPSTPRAKVYISNLSFHDAVTKSVMAAGDTEVLNIAVEDAMKNLASTNPKYVVNGPGHSLSNNDANAKKLNDIFWEPNLFKTEKVDKILNEMMTPAGIDGLVAGQYQQKKDGSVILRPFVISKSSKNSATESKTFTEGEFECADPGNPNKKILCAKTVEAIKDIVIRLLTTMEPLETRPHPGDSNTPLSSSLKSGSDMLAPSVPRILERYRNLRPNDIEAKIADDVFRLGLIWVPQRDSAHEKMLRGMFDRYVSRPDLAGNCLARLMDGARSRARLIDMLMKEVSQYSNTHLSFAKKGNDQVVVSFGTSAIDASADTGRTCVQPDSAAMPQKLEIQVPIRENTPNARPGAAPAQSTFVFFNDYRLSDVDAEIKSWSAEKGRRLRLPIGHEAFMIATAVAYRQTVIDEREINFWFKVDPQRYGYFQLKVDANRNIELADYDIANPPAVEKRSGALFFIVDGD